MKIAGAELMEMCYKDMNVSNISLKEFKEICNAQWRFLRNEIASYDYNSVRLPCFGVFKVYEGRALNYLKSGQVYSNLEHDLFIKERLREMLKRDEEKVFVD